MKTYHLRLFPVAAIFVLALLESCMGKRAGSPAEECPQDSTETAVRMKPQAAPRIATDSVQWKDSLTMGKCKAQAQIAGLYPTGGTEPLLDSVRRWLGEQLSQEMWSPEKHTVTFTPAQLASGHKLAAACGKLVMDRARNDFQAFQQEQGEDVREVDYEFRYSFGPFFLSDSVLTYSFSSYAYLGGAHGGALGMGQSFNCNTGERLTAGYLFERSKRDALTRLLRDALWNQYFKESESSLSDALLISPDALPLPACPPEFGAEGMVFIYQQYEIACYAAGMPQCTLPYSAVAPLMTPKGRRLIPATKE